MLLLNVFPDLRQLNLKSSSQYLGCQFYIYTYFLDLNTSFRHWLQGFVLLALAIGSLIQQSLFTDPLIYSLNIGPLKQILDTGPLI